MDLLLHLSQILVYFSAEKALSLEASVRVKTSPTDQEIVFAAQHRNLTVCVCMCEVERGRFEAG